MSTKDKPRLQRPSYQLKRSVSDSSTLVDAVSSSSLKAKTVDSPPDESPAIAETDDGSDDEWIDGKDYPQFVNKDETWKTITASDMKRCITRLFKMLIPQLLKGADESCHV